MTTIPYVATVAAAAAAAVAPPPKTGFFRTLVATTTRTAESINLGAAMLAAAHAPKCMRIHNVSDRDPRLRSGKAAKVHL